MMRLRAGLLLLACACVPPGARETPAPAAGPRVVRVGDTVQAVLPGDGPRLGDRGVFQAYQLSADSGVVYRVSVISTDFDPVVRIGRVIAGVPDILVENDDGGEGLNALATLNAPAAGEYIVVVHASGGSDSGAFTLSITGSQTTATVAPPRAIRLGEIARDSLAEGGTALYTFSASAGQDLRLTLNSGDFDAFLALGRIVDGAFQQDTTDDDGGDGLNSLLEITIPSDGEYAARVTSVGADGGAFTLGVIDKANPPAAAPVTSRPVVSGTDIAGTLDGESALLERGAAFDQWELTADSGRTYVVTLRAEEFDPLLSVGENRENGFHELWRNDDAPGLGRDSRITFTAARGGAYLIRAQPLEAGNLGRYTLLVESRQPRPATPLTRRIPAGGEAGGTLGEADASLADGSPYQHWVFSARAGERVTLVLRSRADNFDPILAVGLMDGRRFVELSSNDDFEGNDARVVFVAPTSGEYVARVNTFGPEQSGAYELRLERER